MDDNVDTVSPQNEIDDHYNKNTVIDYTNDVENNPYKKSKDPTNQNINNNTITDINQDNIINHRLRSEKMTTRSTNKVLLSGGKSNNNIPKSFKQEWNHPEMSERFC